MSDLLDTILGEESQTEMERILFLPTDDRQPEDDLSGLVEEYSERLGKPGREYDLLPVQALALDQFNRHGGLLANIGVGHGKTLIGLLAPQLADLDEDDTALFLHPARTRDSLRNEIEKHSSNFRISPAIFEMSYAMISQPGGRQRLFNLDPEIIIADEAHSLRSTSSARTKRVRSYFAENADTPFLAMSGTLTNASIKEYAHLADWALRENSPVPRTYSSKDAWSRCLDVSDNDQKFPRSYHWRQIQPLVDAFGETSRELTDLSNDDRFVEARKAFMRRFKTAPGTVKTDDASVGAPIHIKRIEDYDEPDGITSAKQKIEVEGRYPCGAYVDDQLEEARAFRQISCGWYYRWDWPEGEVDREWLYSRREWRQQVKQIVRYGPAEHDTPALVRRAVQQGVYDHNEELMEAWEDWQEHRHKDPPPKETVWVDQSFVQTVARMARDWSPSIVWYQWRATAEALENRGLDVYWPDGNRNPENASPDRSIALSIHSAREGLNIQQYHRNLYVTPPSSGYFWEQSLGRTHRQGQKADSVEVRVFAHNRTFSDCIESALKDARYTSQTQDQSQKILLADWS